MTILRHPSLPDVEPRVERFMTTFGVCAVDRERDLSIYGPELDDYEAAITAWNDWVRPLVELQAEVERRRDGMRHLEASRTELLGTVDAYMNAVERLTADLAAANARAEQAEEMATALRRDVGDLSERLLLAEAARLEWKVITNKANLLTDEALTENERLRATLESLAAQHDGDYNNTSRSNCMASLARAALNDQPEQPT